MKEVKIVKILLALIMMAVSPLLFAEMVTSPLTGVAISYLAEEGTTVKKGEVIYKIYDWWHKNRIEKAKLEVKICESNLEDKKTDIARAKELYRKDAISLAAQENVIVEYYKCDYTLNKNKLKLQWMELDLQCYIFKAPYDCKVVKNILSLESGLDYGDKILEIEPLK